MRKLDFLPAPAQSLFRHFSVLFLERALQLLVTLLLSSVIARQLGAQQFGYFNYLLALLSFTVPLYSLGIARLLVRELIAGHCAFQLLYSSLLLRLAAGFVICVVFICLYLLVNGQDTLWWLWALLLIAQITYAFDVYQFWFQQQQLHTYLALSRLTVSMIFAALKIAAVFLYSALEVVVFIHALELIALPLLYRYLFLQCAGRQRQQEVLNMKLLKPILQQSAYLMLSGVLAVLYLRIDVVMLTHLQGAEVAGVYAAASRLSELWYTIPALMFMVAAPKLLVLHQQSAQLYLLRLKQILSTLLFGAISFALMITLLADDLVHLIYGSSYQSAALVLICHVWSGVFVVWREGLSQWLVAERYAEFSLVSHFSGAVVNVLLNFWLIPLYGALGAAWATVAAYFFSAFVIVWLVARTRVMGQLMLGSLVYPFVLLRSR